jgi:hypothetical protein
MTAAERFGQFSLTATNLVISEDGAAAQQLGVFQHCHFALRRPPRRRHHVNGSVGAVTVAD